ncbi:unnamed protein product [Calypogeia fissa]
MNGAVFELWSNLHRQRLNAENGQPRPSERNSARSRRLRNEGLIRDLCVRGHNAAREQYKAQMSSLSSSHVIITTSFVQESPTASAPLSSLTAISLRQLVLGERHYGRVLHGKLCVKPFMISAIFSVLEDEAGNGVRLTVYNVLSATVSLQDVEARFPMGMRVIVKEPFFKLCADGKTSIRVDNPADIVLDETWKNESPLPDSCNDAELIAELEAIRSKGNELFGAQNWIGAVNKYSKCIDKAIGRMGMQNNKIMADKFNRIVMLAYSNRAEAKLRLGSYEDAVHDADKALEIDQKHVKALVRKGKATFGLGLFEKSCEIFKAALEQSPHEVSILGSLKASTIAHEQSRTGEYDLSSFYSRKCAGDAPFCADFVGPVKIRRVDRGYGRRGLFAIEKLEPGQLLLVSNPLAILRRKADLLKLNLSYNYTKQGGYNGTVSTGVQQDFLTELADQVMKSKRQMAQLYSLSSCGKLDMEIPAMELFRPGSEWVPSGAENMEVDMALIRDIAKLNAFTDTSDNIHELSYRMAKGDTPVKDVSCGLWALPSFANHSCAPNCVLSFIGDAIFIRATVQIAEGEELTVPYFALCEDVETRQSAGFKKWFFTCKCDRCELEETLKPQLGKISKAIPNLVKAAQAESSEQGQEHQRQAVRELARLVDEIEALIQSREIKLTPRQQGWIRAAFIVAYFAKLAMDEHDTQAKITTLKVIVDSMASVSVTDAVLNFAAILLREVEQRYCKQSQSYRLTLDRVLGVYRVVFGNQPDSILHELIRARWVSLGPDDYYR